MRTISGKMEHGASIRSILNSSLVFWLKLFSKDILFSSSGALLTVNMKAAYSCAVVLSTSWSVVSQPTRSQSEHLSPWELGILLIPSNSSCCCSSSLFLLTYHLSSSEASPAIFVRSKFLHHFLLHYFFWYPSKPFPVLILVFLSLSTDNLESIMYIICKWYVNSLCEELHGKKVMCVCVF